MSAYLSKKHFKKILKAVFFYINLYFSYLIAWFTLEFACLHISMIVGVLVKPVGIAEHFVALFADPGSAIGRNGIFYCFRLARLLCQLLRSSLFLLLVHIFDVFRKRTFAPKTLPKNGVRNYCLT